MDSQNSWRCEVLINNVIEKDFQAALLPLNLVQLVFLLPKYYIRDNFITPNGTVANWIICFSGLVLCLCNLYRLINAFSRIYTSVFLLLLNFFDLVPHICGFVMNVFVTVVFSTACVEMILKLHRSYRYLSCDSIPLNNILFWNWVHVVGLIIYYTLLVVLLITYVEQVPVQEMLCMWLVFTFDFNLIFGSRVLRIIRLNFHLWICKVRNDKESVVQEFKTDRCYWKQMFVIYADLLDSYNLYKKIFGAMLLFHTLRTFMQTLFKVQTWIWLGKKSDIHNYFLILSLVNDMTWIPKNLYLESMHSIQCEKLYHIIRQSQYECAYNLRSERLISKRRMYKNVCRLYRATFSKMRACGLFVVDGQLPLRLLGLLTTYTVVLLQFAFNN